MTVYTQFVSCYRFLVVRTTSTEYSYTYYNTAFLQTEYQYVQLLCYVTVTEMLNKTHFSVFLCMCDLTVHVLVMNVLLSALFMLVMCLVCLHHR